MWDAKQATLVLRRNQVWEEALATLDRLRGTYRRYHDLAECTGQWDLAIALAERLFVLEDRLARLGLDGERE